jgi:hypothetical protein
MLKELEKEKTRNPHVQIYQRLRQLFPELPTKYIDSAIYKAKQYPRDKIVVFGGKRLLEKLRKNHLTGKVREGLKRQWKEQRQGTLVSIGSKADKGNRLMRFEDLNGQLCLRITTGNREFIYAKVLREPSNETVQRTSGGTFSQEGLSGFDLSGKTLGVIGTGRIGRYVVKLAHAFDMRIFAYDLSEDKSLVKNYHVEYVELERLLKE